MVVFIRFWRSLTKKDSFESAEYDINFFSTLTPVLGRFFTDPDFPDLDFRLIRIRTQKKTRIRNTVLFSSSNSVCRRSFVLIS